MSTTFPKLAIALLAAATSSIVDAHCDALDGPVVRDAQAALGRGEVSLVLKWVRAQDEDAVRAAFERARVVRTQGDAARELADQFFFETLVRIHRAGEGESFDGLKPPGTTDPGIRAADEALQRGSQRGLARHLSAAVSAGLEQRFATVLERHRHAGDSLDGGRRYVEAYVDYIHFVEQVHGLVTHGAGHRHPSHAGE